MDKKLVMPSVVLTCICLVVSLLLGVVNFFTSEQIAKNNADKLLGGLTEVLPGGENFTAIDLSANPSYPKSISKGYTASNGCVFEITTTGYKPDMVVLVGVGNDGKVTGAKCLRSQETLSHEKTYGDNFVGKDISTVFDIDLIGGATKTTDAYRNAVKDALNAYALASGGEVDDRTPEEILNDNLNTAMGTEGKTFGKWLTAVDLAGADGVYYNEDGVVISVGKVFVAYVDGTAITADVDAETLSKTDAAYAIYAGAVKLDIDSYTGIKKSMVKEIWQVGDNYAMLIDINGFGVNDHYIGNGKPSKAEVVINQAGAIVKVVTIEMNEAAGNKPYGSVIVEESYCGQFTDKTADDFVGGSLGVISGATYTTNGIRNSLKAAFEAFEIVKGVE